MTRKKLRKHYARIMKAFELTPDREIYQSSKMVIDLLNETEWIPVTERLPEEEGFYLVTRRITDDVATFIFRHTPTSNDYWKRCVTAWMPLPQPYKAESEVNNGTDSN